MNKLLNTIHAQQQQYKVGFAYLMSSQCQSEILSLINKIKQYSRVLILGNGGSLTVSLHIEEDLLKMADIPALSMSSTPMMSCLGNDCGFDNIFKIWIDSHLQRDDLVILISSSGESQNIINAAKLVGKNNLVTFTGFNPNNRLNKRGCINIHVPSSEYGVVETTHMAILHCAIDILAKEKDNGTV